MKKIRFLIFILLCTTLFALTRTNLGQTRKGIEFEHGLSWQQVLAKAKEEHKYIFVDAYATWCGPCREMDRKVYPLAKVGYAFNDKFVSIRVQMDTTPEDSEEVKNWYADAKNLREAYNVEKFPGFLFFSPDGKIVHRADGLKTPDEMIQLVAEAIDPAQQSYALLENYKQGKRNYALLPSVAKAARTVGDEKLAKTIAEDYLRNYLDTLSDRELFSEENIRFVVTDFPSLLYLGGSKGRFFNYLYANQTKVDGIAGRKGAADSYVRDIITKEEISDKLWSDGKADKPITQDPDWNALRFVISTKYPAINHVNDLVLDAKISFYKRIKDWAQWAKYMDQKIKAYPWAKYMVRKIKPYPLQSGDGFWKLNLPAWEAFLHCNDKDVLAKALEWSDLSIKVDSPNINHQCLDTRANLLYKLGRVKEAIVQEEKAIKASNDIAKKEGTKNGPLIDDYIKALTQMKKGEPTYLDDGAIWDASTLPKRSSQTESKPPINISVFDNWHSVSNPAITNNGRYVLYEIRNQPVGSRKEGNKTVVVRETKGIWRMELPGVARASFTDDSARAVFIDSKGSLSLLTLGNSSIEEYPKVSSFELFKPNEAEWIVYQTITPDKELVLRSMVSGRQYSLKGATEHFVNNAGNSLVVKTESKKEGGETTQFLNWVNLADGKIKRIWAGRSASNAVFNTDGTQLAFTVEDKTDVQPEKSFWYYKVGMTEAELLANQRSAGIDDGLKLDTISGFSQDGSKIFVKLREQGLKPNPDAVQVDVWSYTDALLQSQQLAELGGTKTYESVIGISDRRIIRLQQKGEKVAIMPNWDSGDYLLIDGRQGDPEEMNWSPASQPSYYLVSVKNGERKYIENFKIESISKGHRYLIGYEMQNRQPRNRELCSYEIATGRIFNISESIPVPLEIDEYSLTRSKGIRAVSWVADTEPTLLIYDKYDIWQVDPAGKKAPINVTNGYGRKNNIKFRIADLGEYRSFEKTVGKDEKILLHAFNLTYKNEGFYLLSLGKKSDPEQLTIGPYDYKAGLDDKPPLKARDADIHLVKRSSATESPNYFWTEDFKSFSPVSEVYPERKYNWLTSELASFRTLDGRTSKGVIYKPEDFDLAKKYPVIIHYYEQKSDNLNKYWELFVDNGGEVSIPWFVSHGYVVFTPDIHYELGKNGQSALNAVLGAADYLGGLPWVDGKHIGIQGHSFGGFETNYIVTHTTRFAAAISSSGMSDLISDYGSLWGQGPSKQGYFENRQGRMGATLWDNPAAYIENSPIFHVDRITTPMLTVANKEDKNVLFAQGLKLFLALRRLGKKAWMLQYDDEGHGVHGKAFVDYTIRSQQFFDHYLKGTPPPKWMTEGVPARMKGLDSGLEFDTSGKLP